MNGLSNARLAVASLVNGVSFLRRSRSSKDDAPVSVLPRLIRRLLTLRRAGRVGVETSHREAVSRVAAQRKRFELLLAQALAMEDISRRNAWLQQSRIAMQELDEMLSARDPLPGVKPPAGAGAGGLSAGTTEGQNE